MLIAVLMMLASSARADLPPFVSDRFDLYQLGSYQNPLTFRYSGTSMVDGYRHETFSGANWQLAFTFDTGLGDSFAGIATTGLPWYLETGTYNTVDYVVLEGVVPYPYEEPFSLNGEDQTTFEGRWYQVEWLEPSGELALKHFILGFVSWASIDCVVCIFVAIKNALAGSL